MTSSCRHHVTGRQLDTCVVTLKSSYDRVRGAIRAARTTAGAPLEVQIPLHLASGSV